MEIFEAIEYERLLINKPKMLEKIAKLICKNCKKLPIPPFRKGTDPEYICHSCLNEMNLPEEEVIVEPSFAELELIDKFLVSCKFCDETFKVKYIFEHENLCLKGNDRLVSICFFKHPDCQKFKKRNLADNNNLLKILCRNFIEVEKNSCSYRLKLNQVKDLINEDNFEGGFIPGDIRDRLDTIQNEIRLLQENYNKEINLKISSFDFLMESARSHKNIKKDGTDLSKPREMKKEYYESKQISMTRYFNSEIEMLNQKINLVEDYAGSGVDNNFVIFEDKNKKTILAYPTHQYSVDLYNIYEKKKEISLKHHTNLIRCIRHFCQSNSNLHYLITTSLDKNVILWNCNLYQVQTIIEQPHESQFIYSSIIFYSNQAHIVTAACSPELMHVFDMEGNKTKSFGCKEETNYIESWSNNIEKFIINANNKDVTIYDFVSTKVYRVFKGHPVSYHFSAFIHEIDKRLFLLESDFNGWVRMWNVREGTLIKSMPSKGVELRGILPWNEDITLAAGYENGKLNVFNLNTGKLVRTMYFYENLKSERSLSTVLKFKHGMEDALVLGEINTKTIFLVERNRDIDSIEGFYSNSV